MIVACFFLKIFQDNIPDTVIQKIQPYIDNEDFQPAAIAKVNLNRVLVEWLKLF